MRQPLVELTVGADDVEAASDVLWVNGATAVEERPRSDGRITLVADAEASAVERAAAGRWPMEVIEVDPDAALDGWRRYARAERAGRRIVVRPPWVPFAAAPGDVVLEIDPGRAFGSGSHPSTRLALTAIDSLADEVIDAHVLDLGCGSGVLAVATVRLGAARVLAIDIDPVAVTVTAANAVRNGVADRVEVSAVPAAEVAGPFEVVLVNISRADAIELAPRVSTTVRPGGCAVIAGFLAVDSDGVADAYASMAVERRLIEAGWGALILRSGRAARAVPAAR